MVEQFKAQLPSAEELLAEWPAQVPVAGSSVHGTARFVIDSFTDPRLLLALGTGQAGALRVGWCLWGTAGNHQDPTELVPAPIPVTLSDPARRALQLLAVDQKETAEAAAVELAEMGVAIEVAQLALETGRHSENDSVTADFGATIYAVLPGVGDADVICVGTPVWLQAQS